MTRERVIFTELLKDAIDFSRNIHGRDGDNARKDLKKILEMFT